MAISPLIQGAGRFENARFIPEEYPRTAGGPPTLSRGPTRLALVSQAAELVICDVVGPEGEADSFALSVVGGDPLGSATLLQPQEK